MATEELGPVAAEDAPERGSLAGIIRFCAWWGIIAFVIGAALCRVPRAGREGSRVLGIPFGSEMTVEFGGGFVTFFNHYAVVQNTACVWLTGLVIGAVVMGAKKVLLPARVPQGAPAQSEGPQQDRPEPEAGSSE